ncbi:MAG TPA: hypothetical protein VE057_04485 [Archangium sp.]|jgi:hypothetical protein|nr:hypothetical protein [Archangium sp.]
MLRVTGITRRERHAALSSAVDAVTSQGGWIAGHQLFSNRMASLDFFLPADRSGALGRALVAAGITLAESVPEALGDETREVRGLLSLTFLHDEPDLRRDVPPFG